MMHVWGLPTTFMRVLAQDVFNFMFDNKGMNDELGENIILYSGKYGIYTTINLSLWILHQS